MKIVVFGLTISSSWGNGHATLWRGLCKALIRRGHAVTFFEHDVPYYAQHRDLSELSGGELVLSDDAIAALRILLSGDRGLVGSFARDIDDGVERIIGLEPKLEDVGIARCHGASLQGCVGR